MVLDRMTGYDLEASQLGELSDIRKTLVATLGETGSESEHSRWEVFKGNVFTDPEIPNLYREMTTVNLQGEWKGTEVKVKIVVGALKSRIQEKGIIDYPVYVDVVMNEEETQYILKPSLDESNSRRVGEGEQDGFLSCLELSQVVGAIQDGRLTVVRE